MPFAEDWQDYDPNEPFNYEGRPPEADAPAPLPPIPDLPKEGEQGDKSHEQAG